MAARTNKYTSVNFNDIYDKQKFNNNPSSNKPNTNNSSSSLLLSNNNVRTSKTIISNSRIQGNMLVLTRPTPKPISIHLDLKDKKENKEKVQSFSKPPDQAETISLRPQGRTGSGAPSLSQPTPLVAAPSGSSSFKTNKFVPPHLRPGFVGKEEKIVGPVGRGVINREIGRPKSGGGYERMMMRGGVGRGGGGGGGGDVDPSYFMNRPGSSGARPNTSG